MKSTNVFCKMKKDPELQRFPQSTAPHCFPSVPCFSLLTNNKIRPETRRKEHVMETDMMLS